MEDYQYGYEDQDPAPQKSIKGYQIIIIVLAVILGALSFIYFNQMNSIKKEYAIERDTLTNRIGKLMDDYDHIQTTNDTLNRSLDIQRDKVDSLMTSLANERRLSMNKLRQYERELGTLRGVMQNYVKQIDSLNTLNRNLIAENVEYRQQITSERLRAEKAEEKADEMSTRIRQGSVIKARDIKLVALSNNDREVSRASRAARLRVDFVLSGNELATPGDRTVYVRLTGPDNYILVRNASDMFAFEGESRTFSAARDIDYQNQDLGVSLFYNGTGITSGTYGIEIYMDGYLVGATQLAIR